MKYRNKVTQTIIDVNSKISGGDWEEIKEKKKKGSAEEPETDTEKDSDN